MGIVRKVLGEEALTKNDLMNIKESVEGEVNESNNTPIEEEQEEYVPSGIEMFVRISDYNKITRQLKRLESAIGSMEELERMHSEMQEIHDNFTEKLESVLGEIEEIKEELHSKFGKLKR